MVVAQPEDASDARFDFYGAEFAQMDWPEGAVWTPPLEGESRQDARPSESAVASMYDLECLLRRFPALHLRHAPSPWCDAGSCIDPESGLTLPGVPAQPLQPESWWHRPIADWLARQITAAEHEDAGDSDGESAELWLLTGIPSGRGPDGTPLLTDTVPIGRVADETVAEARARYRDRFSAHHSEAPATRP